MEGDTIHQHLYDIKSAAEFLNYAFCGIDDILILALWIDIKHAFIHSFSCLIIECLVSFQNTKYSFKIMTYTVHKLIKIVFYEFYRFCRV